jgi:hypothetical protein
MRGARAALSSLSAASTVPEGLRATALFGRGGTVVRGGRWV